MTGLSTATVATVMGDLLSGGIVTEVRTESGGIGRPATTLRLNGDRGRVVGVDVAETYVRATVFDVALAELGAAEVAADEHRGGTDYVIDAVVRAIESALERAGVAREDVLGVGVSLPGGMQRSSSVSVVVPNEIWHHLDRLRERVGLPVVVDNPLKAIATAELWFGEGRRHSSMITVNLGTGVGAGIVLEGKVLRGAQNTAGSGATASWPSAGAAAGAAGRAASRRTSAWPGSSGPSPRSSPTTRSRPNRCSASSSRPCRPRSTRPLPIRP
ncbi:hypothetical protein GCM10029992_57230 [Glycomyces albus]